ncbi:MAG: glycoside hydrolase [Halobacteriales archaeon]|nr:glycoside hydrolase [Halobacteriales archaeon]
MRALPALALLLPLLAGCIGQPAGLTQVPFADLTAEGARVLDLPSGVREFLWNGTTRAVQGSMDPLGLTPAEVLPQLVKSTLQVDRRVGFVGLDVQVEGNRSLVSATLLDDSGRVQCFAARVWEGPSGLPGTCTTPVPANATSPKPWTLQVQQTGAEGGKAYEVRLALHPMAHERHGDPLAGVDRSITFRAVDTKYNDSALNLAPRRAEPNVGVLRDGSIFGQFGAQTLRSADRGATWQDVSPAWEYYEGTHDPMLRADPWTNTVYISHLLDPNGLAGLSWTLDAGQTWLHNRAVGLPNQDHQKMATGPSLVPGAPLPILYYSYAYFPLAPAGDEGAPVFVARSIDGGLTFTQGPVTGLTDGTQPGNTGPIEADRAGNVYIPLNMCQDHGSIAVAVSHDMGQGWKVVQAGEGPLNCSESLDPGLAVDMKGNVYVAWLDGEGVKFAASKDHGDTWAKPVKVSLPQLGAFAHVDAVAGDEGKLAIVYQGTPDTGKTASIADGWALWNTYVAYVSDAAGSPTVQTGMVNPPDDPVQRGCIWMWGGGNPCRNLLDFVDIQLQPDGRVVVVYADGCPQVCETPADSRLHQGIVGVQDEGPRLFAGKAPWA